MYGQQKNFQFRHVADTNLDLGQVYYNSTSNAFKVTKTIFGTGAWASGGALNTARYWTAGEQELQTACFNSFLVELTQVLAIAEQYNGTAWTEVADDLIKQDIA